MCMYMYVCMYKIYIKFTSIHIYFCFGYHLLSSVAQFTTVDKIFDRNSSFHVK